jgi:hypothetical protein
VDAPSKLTLLCVRCHEAQHSKPEWSDSGGLFFSGIRASRAGECDA